MLVSAKVIHLLLIFILLKGKLSNAHCPKGLNIATGGCNNAASNGESLVDESNSQIGLRKLTLIGRKMAIVGVMWLEKLKGIGKHEETCITSSRESVKEQRKVSSYVLKGQQRMRSLLSSKKALDGFGALTADYKGPMYHPPRHN